MSFFIRIYTNIKTKKGIVIIYKIRVVHFEINFRRSFEFVGTQETIFW